MYWTINFSRSVIASESSESYTTSPPRTLPVAAAQMPPKKKQPAGLVGAGASSRAAAPKTAGAANPLEEVEAHQVQTSKASQAKPDATKPDANTDAPPRRKTKKREPVIEEPHFPSTDDVRTLRVATNASFTNRDHRASPRYSNLSTMVKG